MNLKLETVSVTMPETFPVPMSLSYSFYKVNCKCFSQICQFVKIVCILFVQKHSTFVKKGSFVYNLVMQKGMHYAILYDKDIIKQMWQKQMQERSNSTMGFFSNSYTKEGPGVPKNAPQKKGVARFFEILGRDMGPLWRAGMLTTLCFLPSAAAVVFGILFHQYLGMVRIAAAIYVLGAMLIGPALTALHAVVIKTIRNIPGYMWHDYKKAFKDNARQSVPAGMTFMVLLAIETFSTYYYLFMVEKVNFIMLALVLFCMILIITCGLFMFLQILFIDLPLFGMAKNSLMLLFGFAKRSLPAGLIVIVSFVVFGVVIVWPITFIFLLLGLFAWVTLIVDMWAWPVMEKAFHVTERQEEKKAEEAKKGILS